MRSRLDLPGLADPLRAGRESCASSAAGVFSAKKDLIPTSDPNEASGTLLMKLLLVDVFIRQLAT